MENKKNHVTKEYTIFQIALNLIMFCFVSGLILSTVYYFTNPIAEKNMKILENKQMQALIPEADAFSEVEGHSGWYAAEKGGELVGYAVKAHGKGYGGTIEMMVGVSTDFKVLGYSVLSHDETPGLGDKMLQSPFKDYFVGRTADSLVITKDANNTSDIQAITSATITSKAVANGIQAELIELEQSMGGK